MVQFFFAPCQWSPLHKISRITLNIVTFVNVCLIITFAVPCKGPSSDILATFWWLKHEINHSEIVKEDYCQDCYFKSCISLFYKWLKRMTKLFEAEPSKGFNWFFIWSDPQFKVSPMCTPKRIYLRLRWRTELTLYQVLKF